MKHTDSMEYNSLWSVKFNPGKIHTQREIECKCPKMKDTQTSKGEVQRGYLEMEILHYAKLSKEKVNILTWKSYWGGGVTVWSTPGDLALAAELD